MTTTDLVRGFNEIDDILDEIPNETLEPGRFHWLHGVKQARTPGVFFARATEFNGTPPSPWKEDNRFDNEPGFNATELHIAFIGFRSQWFFEAEDKGKPRIWLSTYQEGAKKITEYLCFVKGIDDPMVLSVSGKNKAGPLFNIFTQYERNLLKAASRVKGRQLPRWCFWLPIANQRTGDGKTAYVEATDANNKGFGSFVTPPCLFLPDRPIPELFDMFYVGNTIARQGAEIRAMYDEWFGQKRTVAGVVEGEIIHHPQLAAPAAAPVPQVAVRNVPQSIDLDSDEPF